MNPSEIRRYLDARSAQAPGTKIQYGHPSPRFWSPSSSRLDDLLSPVHPDRDLALYVHIPFCVPTEPSACGFCLFAREDLGPYAVVQDYVDTLLLELEQTAALTGRRTLGALYFGGGTPNVLKDRCIRRLFARIHELFVVTPSTEVTFEGYPPLFTQERLETLRDVGCTRISLGVQTLDPELLSASGRAVARQQTIQAITFCAQHGIRCNADLITGWFNQTPADVVRDAEQLIDWGVTGICNHLLAVAGDSAFSHRAAELPPTAVMIEAFLAARDAMLERGFRADGYTDYSAPDRPPVRYLEMYRDVFGSDRIGVGYGANSLLLGTLEQPGHTWKNVADLAVWRERVRAGRATADTVFAFAPIDMKLLHVLKGLEGTPWLDEATYAERFGASLREDFAAWWQEFEARGWLQWAGGSPQLVGEGLYYTALVQRSLSEPRNRTLRALRPTGGRRSLVLA